MLKLLLLSAIFIIIPAIYGEETYRLQNSTRPEVYMVFLDFNDFETNLTFKGEVLIKIKVKNETNKVTLHSAVNIESAAVCSIFVTDCSSITLVTLTYDPDREFVHITTSESLKVGIDYYLDVKFSGEIGTMTSNVRGIYRGSYSEGVSTQ